MSNLSVRFTEKKIFVDNYQCCPRGVVVSFDIENVVLGGQYRCTFSNVGDSDVVSKPQNFKITGIQPIENFSAVLELSKSRMHIVKITVENMNNSSDVAEDILTIECGPPNFVEVQFSTKNNAILCNNDPHNLVAELSNLVVGNTYEYSFEPINPAELSNIVFLPSSGSFRANSTNQNINTIVKYNGVSDSVLIKMIVMDHYNDFSNSALATLTCQ